MTGAHRTRCRGLLPAVRRAASVGDLDDPSRAAVTAQLLAREVAAGVAAGLADERLASTLELRDVTVRLGSDVATSTWHTQLRLGPPDHRAPAARPAGVDALAERSARRSAVARLSIRTLQGVGVVWERRLSAIGVTSVADLAALDLDTGAADDAEPARRGLAVLSGRARALLGAVFPPRAPIPPKLTVSEVALAAVAELVGEHSCSPTTAARWRSAATVAVSLLEARTCDRLPLTALACPD